jgi:hypothetical protein
MRWTEVNVIDLPGSISSIVLVPVEGIYFRGILML